MIELAQHINSLLLENDCVIIPGFGGFVAHYTCAEYVKDENLFLPPTRNVGFNSQLKINDGVLAQSFMSAYGTNFADANHRIDREVSQLIDTLHTEGKVRFENIGEVVYNINGNYEFIPYPNKLITPSLYGLDSFEMQELSILQHKEIPMVPAAVKVEKKTYDIRIRRSVIRNVAAVAAAVVLFFMFSTPVENTNVPKNNYAQLMPNELFNQIVAQSVAMTPIMTQTIALSDQTKKKTDGKLTNPKTSSTKPIRTRDVKAVKKNETTPQAKPVTENKPTVKPLTVNHPYHIIVAGGITVKDAEAMVNRIKKEFPEAQVLNNEGKVRVSVYSFDNKDEAYRQLIQLRGRDYYADAWLLTK